MRNRELDSVAGVHRHGGSATFTRERPVRTYGAIFQLQINVIPGGPVHCAATHRGVRYAPLEWAACMNFPLISASLAVAPLRRVSSLTHP